MMIFNMILLGFLVVCAVSVSFSKIFKFDPDIYVLQPDHVDYLDTFGIAGPGDHRSGRRCRRNEHTVFVTLKKIHALQQEPKEGENDESYQETE